MAPIQELLENVKFAKTKACNNVFNKEYLTKAPLLRHPNLNKLRALETNASNIMFASVLLQEAKINGCVLGEAPFGGTSTL